MRPLTLARIRRAPRTLHERARMYAEEVRHRRRPKRPPAAALAQALEGMSVEEFVGGFAERSERRWFLTRDEMVQTAALLAEGVDGWRDGVIADADRLLGGTVRLLGRGAVAASDLHAPSAPDWPGAIPWHDDSVNDYRWNPATFHRRVPQAHERADVKVPWELSRFQQLPTLGMAHVVTGDERYPAEAVRWIDDWIEHNPAGYGINWNTSMEVAIRAVNWLWGHALMAGSPALTGDFVTRMLASLLEHGRHVASNLEIYEGGVTTNHTLADYAGLVHLGLLLPELREAREWTRIGREGLSDCMRDHVTADGVHFENSIPYHRLVLEMLAASHVLARRNGAGLGAEYEASLERMVEFAAHYTRPDGLAPLVGDSDDGRLHVLGRYFDWDPQDHRHLLALGGALFERPDLAAAARDAPGAAAEAAWLVGPEAARGLLERGEAESPAGTRAFAEGGRYVMRNGADHLIVCADEVGTFGLGNHKHNDILGYELTLAGTAIVVDRGSFVYQSSSEWRDRFRSTRSHSTVVVDGLEQNEMTGPFGMREDAQVAVSRWSPGPRADVLDATHTGYLRAAAPVSHRRVIVLGREVSAVLVVDLLDGEGSHDVESRVQLHPGGAVRPEAGLPESALAAAGDVLARLASEAGVEEPLTLHGEGARTYERDGLTVAVAPLNVAEVSVAEAWHSPRYLQREPAPALVLSTRVGAGEPFGYLILPVTLAAV
jgi:hypothetical protein